jgi:hypothetical protein
VAGELFDLDDAGFALPIDKESAPAQGGRRAIASTASLAGGTPGLNHH